MAGHAFEAIDPATIPAVLATVDELWSLPSSFEATGVHHGYRQITVALSGRYQLDGFADWCDRFAPLRTVWLSRIQPGGFIVEHIDAGPFFERWQIPLTTTGVLVQGGTPVSHQVGTPFRVRQFDWHSVHNHADADRVSLVIDRDVPLDVPTGPQRLRHNERGT